MANFKRPLKTNRSCKYLNGRQVCSGVYAKRALNLSLLIIIHSHNFIFPLVTYLINSRFHHV
nr:MAG TPA: hypothetical protein [Inoviridae sp.]